MPPLPPPSMATRKRTRSTNISENNLENHQTVSLNSIPTTTATSVNIASLPTNTVAANAPPKRQRNNPPLTGLPPPVIPRTSYSFRNRSLTPDPRHPSTRFPSLQTASSSSPRSANRQRYNLRPRRPQSQVRLPQVPTPHPIIAPRRIRRPIPPITPTAPSSLPTNVIQPSSLSVHSPAPAPPPPPSAPVPLVTQPVTFPTPPVIQPRQYRLVYISDDDDEPFGGTQATATIVNTTFNLVTDDDEDDELIRQHVVRRRASRSTPGAGFNTR
jgi:hypothetical protein